MPNHNASFKGSSPSSADKKATFERQEGGRVTIRLNSTIQFPSKATVQGERPAKKCRRRRRVKKPSSSNSTSSRGAKRKLIQRRPARMTLSSQAASLTCPKFKVLFRRKSHHSATRIAQVRTLVRVHRQLLKAFEQSNKPSSSASNSTPDCGSDSRDVLLIKPSQFMSCSPVNRGFFPSFPPLEEQKSDERKWLFKLPNITMYPEEGLMVGTNKHSIPRLPTSSPSTTSMLCKAASPVPTPGMTLPLNVGSPATPGFGNLLDQSLPAIDFVIDSFK
mmetsp:Transcript_30113/g.41992  ORF Transcript_30113/g.41992 Transcript_30113/m.41992 type:complete len:276 (+) Transcript_30113:53-880(+)|eukprot:jgi/Bigna1/91588/estExt_fgenesh1_pg.C_1080011